MKYVFMPFIASAFMELIPTFRQAKREHASQQTDLLAEKTQELNDLRAQKAADDVSFLLTSFMIRI